MAIDTSSVPDLIAQKDEAIAGFKNVAWNDLARAGANLFIDANDVRVLNELEQCGLEGIRDDEEAVARTILSLLKVIRNVTTSEAAQHYALTRLEDLISGQLKGPRINLFMRDGERLIDSSPFMRLVINGSHFSQKMASRILARLYSHRFEGCETFLTWLMEQLRTASSAPAGAKLAVGALVLLLRSVPARRHFHQVGGLALLSAVLGEGSSRALQSNAQFQYEGCFCLWTLTLVPEVIADLHGSGALEALCSQVARAPREKVIRVAIAALRNAVAARNSDIVQTLLVRGLSTSLQGLSQRQWTDPDIMRDVEEVRSELLRNFREITSFERYEAEVESGVLSWGILHDAKFFQENCRLMEGNDFKVIRRLIALLSSGRVETVAVACHDIGEFARFYPNGKSIVGHLNGKPMVMALMAHPDAEVQRRALACISKLMLQSGHADAVAKTK